MIKTCVVVKRKEMRVLMWRKKVLAVLGFGAAAVVYLLSWLADDLTCSNSQSTYMLAQMCDDFHHNLIAGNLCPEICDKRAVIFQKCVNYRRGKKILIAYWGQTTIVLKCKKEHWSDFDPVDFAGNFPTIGQFIRMVKESLTFTLDMTINDVPQLESYNVSVLSNIWSMDVSKFTGLGQKSKVNQVRLKAVMRSIWSLIQQDEYALLTVLKGHRHIPKLLGTCGHFYAMEHLSQGKVLSPEVLELTGLSELPSWRARLRVSVGLLEAVNSYEEEFHETLHLCDVKGENFGVDEDGVIKLLDLDTVFFSSKLKKELGSNKCTTNSDCDFFDCLGLCDLRTNKCTSERINNNLQVICKKILSNKFSNKYMGILRAAPEEIEERLTFLLDECISPKSTVDEETVNRLHAPVQLLDRLYSLLQRELLYSTNEL